MITRTYIGFSFDPHGLSIARAQDGKLFDWKNQVWSTPPGAFNDPTLPNFFLPFTPTQVFGNNNSPELLRLAIPLPAPSGGSVSAFFPDGRYSCTIHVLEQTANNNPLETWEVQLWGGSDQAPQPPVLPATATITGTVTFGH